MYMQTRKLSFDIANIHMIRYGSRAKVWFQSTWKRLTGFEGLHSRTASSVQLLHDLISMTLMKGSGLFDEVDGLSGLL